MKNLIVIFCLAFSTCSVAKTDSLSTKSPQIILESFSPKREYKVEISEQVLSGQSDEKYGNHTAQLVVYKKNDVFRSQKIDEGDSSDSLFQNEYKQIKWIKENVFMIDGMSEKTSKDKIFVQNTSNQIIQFLSVDTTVLQKYFGVEIPVNDKFTLEMFPHNDYVEIYAGVTFLNGGLFKKCTFGLNRGALANTPKTFTINVTDRDIEISSPNFGQKETICSPISSFGK